MEFGRRLAAERDLEKSDSFNFCNIGMSLIQSVIHEFINAMNYAYSPASACSGKKIRKERKLPKIRHKFQK